MNTELNELATKLISELSETAKNNVLNRINKRVEYALKHFHSLDLSNMFVSASFTGAFESHEWAMLHTYDIKYFPLLTEEKRVEISHLMRIYLDGREERERRLDKAFAEADAATRKLSCRVRMTLDKHDELVSRINRILEEKYPRNPDPDYVAAKIARTLGEDAWSELHGSFEIWFPSLDEDSKKEISDKLRAYLIKENIGYLLWDE